MSNKTRIIAFGHRQRVGKDTAARFLTSEIRMKHPNSNIQKCGFADKVKSIAFELYSWAGLMPGEFYEDLANAHLREIVLPLIGKSPRGIWIGLGNGLRSSVFEGTWLQYLLRSKKCQLLIVKDMRFPIEADGILDLGGCIYRIDRDDAPVVNDGADDPLVGYDKWTGVIKNNSTLYDFHSEIVKIAKEII